MIGIAISLRNEAFEGGNEACKTSMAEEVETLILWRPRLLRERLMRRMAGTRWGQVRLGVDEMISLPTRM